MRSILTACAFMVGGVAIAAPVPKERAEADRVVGKWKLVKSSNTAPGFAVSLEMELTSTGKLILRQSVGGGPMTVFEGEYKVMKDQLPYSVKYPGGGEKKETLTIKKLTETELIVVDPDGIQEDFERVKPQPKPDEKK